MNGFVVDDEESSGSSGKTFHPTPAGHVGYAEILEQYIVNQIRDPQVKLTEAGLPTNPVAVLAGIRMSESGSPLSGGNDSTASKRFAELQPNGSPRSADDGGGASDGRADVERSETSWGVLGVRRAAAVSGCGAPFVSPGEQVTLTAGGFAPDATVTFSAAAASQGDAELAEPTLADATADAHGWIEVAWTVPAAPAAAEDAAPRAYALNAVGIGTAGETRTAYMARPLVAYPGTAPCMNADAATTQRDTPVQVPVLTNDTAPTSGTLDAATVKVHGAPGGTFSTNAATGVVTFIPDRAYRGTVETTYVVYDQWGIGVGARLTITVDSGCTITGTAGIVRIDGTDGDDVICVPDPDDHRAFHVIHARGGNDTVIGGDGIEWVYGGAGADMIYGRGGNDRIVAGTGTDTIYGGTGMDTVYSADLADSVVDDDGGYEIVVAPSVTV